METEIIYWKHATPVGVSVEEFFGGEDKSQKLFLVLARQIFGENGGDRYREIGHLPSGAPFVEDSEQRLSLSHTGHFLVAALLPRTPECDLAEFNPRTAMGVDVEADSRSQASKVVARILSKAEIELINEYCGRLMKGDAHHQPLTEDEASTRSAILLWTLKEALYKAALTDGLDYARDLQIVKLPEIASTPQVPSPQMGEGILHLPAGDFPMTLYSYESENHIISIAISPRAAKFSNK